MKATSRLNLYWSEPNLPYQPYCPLQSTPGRLTQIHRDEAARKLEGVDEGVGPRAINTSDGDVDDVKSEGS